VPTHPRTFRLSPHFTWGEFWPVEGSPPPDELLIAARALCVMWLEPVRAAFGVCVIHSGYRTEAHNRAVGGAPQSIHLGRRRPAAIAADVTFRSGTPRQWYEAFDRLGAPGLGIYPTHVHVDNRSGRARW